MDRFAVRFASICFCLVAASALAQGLPAVGARPSAREPQTAEEAAKCTVAVVGDARGGGTVRVTASFEMVPGWHIYWENAGESGAPTRIDLELPEGCTATGQVDFPMPAVFTHGETTFGYEGSVVLSTEVKLPAQLPATLPAKVKVRWLACKGRCLMGSAEATIDLAKGLSADSAAGKALAASLAAVPQALPPDWKVSVEGVGEETARLEISAPGSIGLDQPWMFIPFDTPGVVLASGYKADAKGRSAKFELALSRESSPVGGPEELPGKRLEAGGLVVLGKKGPSYSFRTPIPPAP